jgi:hypothetical protein
MTHLSEALTRLTSSWDAPSSTDDAYLRQARTRIDAILADVEALFAGEISDYRDLTRRAGVELLGEKD